MGAVLQRIIYFLQYMCIRGALLCLRVLPFKARVALMAKVGGVAMRYIPKFRNRVEAGLRRVYPDMGQPERLNLVKAIGQNTLRSLTELLYNRELAKQVDTWTISGPGLEVLQQAKAAGTGAIIVSGHFGQWEAIRHALKARGIEVGAVYRPNNNPYYEPLFVDNVEQGGRPLVPKGKAGTMDMVRHIRKGGFMAILPDQKYSRGENLAFLGHTAKTTTAPADLALKYNIPLVPAYGIRRTHGLDVVFEAPINPASTADMMQAVNDSLAARIETNPDQWHWAHQRWQVQTAKPKKPVNPA